MGGRFGIYKDPSGCFRFQYTADDGRTIRSSEKYETEAEALRRVEMLRANVSPRRRSA